ncbi:MAG TPA: Tm-1-like ATP-binding domain-containing protein [Burkholderiaceae bacterium]|nr:Tm-1-like ATP-binding domain-containing protein [Burkholderiaceae bacterium]
MNSRPSLWVVGTFDTKADELLYMAGLIRAAGVPVLTIDISTRGKHPMADVTANEVADCHELGRDYVLAGSDRGLAVTAMGQALRQLVRTRYKEGGICGMLGIGGSGGTSMIAPAMHELPFGMPKLLVTTLASGDTSAFVGSADLCVINPVTDLAGLNRLSRNILANAAHAIVGMLTHEVPAPADDDKAAIGLSMFGVTTPCVQSVVHMLEDSYDCQVFHANGAGGKTMEALAKAGMLSAIIDITTTEVGQHLAGGVCDAGPGRLAAAAELGIPWVGSLGALDMINWGAPPTIPEQYKERLFHVHNPQVTLMRSTAAELKRAGLRIAEQLNRSPGVVHLFLPINGLSALDAPGQPFHDPEANQALFQALEQTFEATPTHRIHKVQLHINDPAFAQLVASTFRSVVRRS